MSFVYNNAKRGFANAEIDWDDPAITVNLMLVNSLYTPDADDIYVSDVVVGECSGTGYVRKTLSTRTTAQDDTNDVVNLLAENLLYTTLSCGTVSGCIVFIKVNDDSDSILLAFINSGGFPKTTVGYNFSINWPSGVVIQFAGE